MNKEYMYIDGNAIISDTEGNQRQSEYYDNLDQVLVHENIIEEIEKRIHDLTAKKKNLKIKKYIPYMLPLLAGLAIAAPTIYGQVFDVNPYLNHIETIFGSMNEGLVGNLMAVTFAIPLGLLIEMNDFEIHKKRIRTKEAITSELDFLQSELAKEKEIVAKLQAEKTNSNEPQDFEIKEIDDFKKIDSLRKDADYHYNLGYYSEELEAPKQELNQKGPVLVKRKNK